MYDMKLHAGRPPDALAAWIELEKGTRLGYVDGSIFPTVGGVNPSLTIYALAMRMAHRIGELNRRGEL